MEYDLNKIRSEHFTLAEMLHSNEATKRGIDNVPPLGSEIYGNIERLIANVLEPARCKLGAPVIISSGYRCPELNNAVGGVNNSDHMMGNAADLVCNKLEDKKRLFEILKKMDVDQLLWERNSKGTQWIHVSYRGAGQNRHMVRDNYVAK